MTTQAGPAQRWAQEQLSTGPIGWKGLEMSGTDRPVDNGTDPQVDGKPCSEARRQIARLSMPQRAAVQRDLDAARARAAELGMTSIAVNA